MQEARSRAVILKETNLSRSASDYTCILERLINVYGLITNIISDLNFKSSNKKSSPCYSFHAGTVVRVIYFYKREREERKKPFNVPVCSCKGKERDRKRVKKKGKMKENSSCGAKIQRDPWKSLSDFGLFGKCLMVLPLNELTPPCRRDGDGSR